MRVVSTRKEVTVNNFVTIELTEQQLLAIVGALGVSSPYDIKSEVNTSYDKEVSIDTQALYESLAELVTNIGEMNDHSVKMPKSSNFISTKPIDYMASQSE